MIFFFRIFLTCCGEKPNEYGHAVLRHWCSSVPVFFLLKYWQVVDLRFSIIWLEDTAENITHCKHCCAPFITSSVTLLDEAGLRCADVKQDASANILLGFGLNIIEMCWELLLLRMTHVTLVCCSCSCFRGVVVLMEMQFSCPWPVLGFGS